MLSQLLCRDEIDRLMEILNSRLVDIVDVDGEKKEPRLSIGGESKMNLLASGSPLTLIDGKQEDMNRAILGTSTPHLQSKVSILPLSTILSIGGIDHVDNVYAYSFFAKLSNNVSLSTFSIHETIYLLLLFLK